jgi:hypothetical protein
MRKEFCAASGISLLILVACQSQTSASAAQKQAVTALPVSESQASHSPTSLCARDETPVLSCKLEASGKITSLCAARASGSAWKFRFVYGTPGQPPGTVSPLQGVDDGRGFARSRLMLFGGAGGLVYSTVSDGRRYAMYSIQGKGFSRAGLQISPPGAETATSDEACLQETLIESDDDDLLDAVDRWGSDPSLQDKNLPSLDH